MSVLPETFLDGRYVVSRRLGTGGTSAVYLARDVVLEREVAVKRLVETIATHTNRVDHCSGTLRTVRGAGGRWLVEPAGVQCTAS